MTLANDLSDTLTRRKWKCDICGKVDFWSNSWFSYGSFAMEETCPEDIPTVCGIECKKEMEKKFSSGEFVLPKLSRIGPVGQKVIKNRQGY